jgi:hypothetical protein
LDEDFIPPFLIIRENKSLPDNRMFFAGMKNSWSACTNGVFRLMFLTLNEYGGWIMKRVVLLILVAFFLGFSSVCYAEEINGVSKVPRMGIDELKGRLTDAQVVVIDVRSPHDWDDSTTMIKGAIRENPEEVDRWKDKYSKDNVIALYCK